MNDLIAVQKVQDHCWYAPCQDSDNRPADSTCPGGDVYACLQISQDNTYTSGGTQEHEQKCVMPNSEAPAPGDTGAKNNDDNAASGGRRDESFPPPPPPPATSTPAWIPAVIAVCVGAIILLVVIIVWRLVIQKKK